MNRRKQYRQGDLLFVEVNQLPRTARRVEHRVIAEGETTGHMHQVLDETAVLYEDGNVKFLEALGDASVVHEEHGTLVLPKGLYRVIRQREYSPDRVRKVRD
jgi:hypothetical protein